MKTVGPFVAARALDTPPKHGAARPVVTMHALDRLTGMPALVYLLPQAVALPDLPDTPSLLPYAEVGVQHGQAYVACELPPHAAQARDPLQTALGGLRALNALHEAGLIHGGVGPAQLWEWNDDVRLGGAGLPWGEAQGALAAPEGGASPAADLYALGVTLLRMGPLPAGLSDLLSPYPAQRPSARDALARFNAGPPLPPERTPLIVEAPLHPRGAEVALPPVLVPTPLPLVADPDAHGSETKSAPPVGLAVTDPPAQAASPVLLAAAPELVVAPVTEITSGAPILDWDEVQLSEEALAVAAPEASVPLPEVELPTVLLPTSAVVLPEEAPVSLVKPNTQNAAQKSESPPGPASPLVFAAAPPSTGIPAEVKVAEAEQAGLVTPPAVPATTDSTTTDPAVVPLGRDMPPRRFSPRQLKPVKIGWSQDGSWKAVKEGQSGAAELASAQSGARPAFNRLWLIGAAVALVAVLLIGRLANRPAPVANVAACCTVTSQLVGSDGQALSAPVNIKLVGAPDGSQLQAGALVGQAPGTLKLDAPGAYTLSIAADGYASQNVELMVPTQEPLKIVLK